MHPMQVQGFCSLHCHQVTVGQSTQVLWLATVQVEAFFGEEPARQQWFL